MNFDRVTELKKQSSATFSRASRLPARHSVELAQYLPFGHEPKGVGHDFSRIAVHDPFLVAKSCPLANGPRACPFGGACHSCPPKIQAKLAVSQPGDAYEQEADEVANRVMLIPLSSVNNYQSGKAETTVQNEQFQSAKKVPEIDDDLENRLSQRRGEGNPLPDDVRAFIEPRFGFDSAKYGYIRVVKSPR
jgi:hypothetical protein